MVRRTSDKDPDTLNEPARKAKDELDMPPTQSSPDKKRSKWSKTYRLHRIRFYEFAPLAINCIACSPEQNELAASRSDGSIEIWSVDENTAHLTQKYKIYNAPDTSIEALIWRSGSLYSAGLEGDLVQYDMNLLKPQKLSASHAGAIWCLDLSPCKNFLAAGTEEGCIVLYEHNGEGFDYCRSLQKQEERIMSVCWHSSGEYIVSGDIDNIRMWSVEPGHAILRITLPRQNPDKPTIVWAVAVLKDKTIVSGDSRGKVCFWNGDYGTLQKAFSCHKADVLSLCINDSEKKVYASGIDPTLVQFELAPVNESSDWRVWHRAAVTIHHTHDVRAVTRMNGFILSGGVDCSLVSMNLKKKLKHKSMPLPQSDHIHLASEAKLVLLQYPNLVQLWRLGTTNLSTAADSTADTEYLPLSQDRAFLMELRSTNEEQIVCSSISSCGSWLAYANRNQLRIFRFHLDNSDLIRPRISATRMKSLPTELNALPIRCLTFSSGGLVVGYIDGSVKYVKLANGSNSITSSDIISSQLPGGNISAFGILTQLDVSPESDIIAVCGSGRQILVYHLSETSKTMTLVNKPPRRESPVTCLRFSPQSDKLAIAYSCSHNKLVEYDLLSKKYCKFVDKPTSSNDKWTSPFTSIQYMRSDANLLLLKSALGVHVYDSRTGEIGQRNLFDHRYLMHFEELEDDFAVAVERSPVSISGTLPQALSKKRFGT